MGRSGGKWEDCGAVGTLRRDGDDNSCVTSRRRLIPGPLSGILSSAAQPLLPKKPSSAPIPWELKLVVTKSYSVIRAGNIFRS